MNNQIESRYLIVDKKDLRVYGPPIKDRNKQGIMVEWFHCEALEGDRWEPFLSCYRPDYS